MPKKQRIDIRLAFGGAVKKLRLQRDCSQEELAAMVGIHRTYIGDIERGRRNVGLINIGRIASALGVTMTELVAEAEKFL